MRKLVNSLEAVVAGIEHLNSELPNYPRLADRLGQAHAFYVLERDGREPKFGFSKFVGYDSLHPTDYLRDYKALDGRNTEHALKPWFEEVTPGTTAYKRLFDKLSDWLASYGKKPRGGSQQQVRIMVVRPEMRSPSAISEDRRLLELLVAVADLLPTKQRLELRSAL